MREALGDHPPWMHGCPVPANGTTIPNLPLLLIAADHTTGGNSLVEVGTPISGPKLNLNVFYQESCYKVRGENPEKNIKNQ